MEARSRGGETQPAAQRRAAQAAQARAAGGAHSECGPAADAWHAPRHCRHAADPRAVRRVLWCWCRAPRTAPDSTAFPSAQSLQGPLFRQRAPRPTALRPRHVFLISHPMRQSAGFNLAAEGLKLHLRSRSDWPARPHPAPRASSASSPADELSSPLFASAASCLTPVPRSPALANLRGVVACVRRARLMHSHISQIGSITTSGSRNTHGLAACGVRSALSSTTSTGGRWSHGSSISL